MKKPLWMRRAGLATLALAVVGAVGFVLLRAGPLAPLQVTVITVQEGRLHPAIFGVGTVEARRSWMVGPTTAGRVLNVQVDVGDVVKAGQLLAEMDAVDMDQRLSALDATVARARSTQAAAAAQLADATARRELAQLNAQRNQNLAAQNFISAGALESRLQEKPQPMLPCKPHRPTSAQRARTLSAFRPNVPHWPSSAAMCACWHRPTRW